MTKPNKNANGTSHAPNLLTSKKKCESPMERQQQLTQERVAVAKPKP